MGGHGSAEQQGSEQQTMSNQQQNPCHYELQQFVECAQNSSDMSYCQGFKEVLKQCKIDHGTYPIEQTLYDVKSPWHECGCNNRSNCRIPGH